MPRELIRALALVKRPPRVVNRELGTARRARRPTRSSPPPTRCSPASTTTSSRSSVWQTGSGTQTNMNMNEVLANRAIASCSAASAAKSAWCTRTTTSTAASRRTTCSRPRCTSPRSTRSTQRLLPALRALRDTLAAKAQAFADIVKIGRTHLQDATPLTLGQEFSRLGRAARPRHRARRSARCRTCCELALGGTAVGTGLNAHPEFGARVAARARASSPAMPFVTAPNKFEALAAHDALVHAHGALKTLAASLMKIANDVRWLASGPRCGHRRDHASRRTSRAARSCRARSTRRSARR